MKKILHLFFIFIISSNTVHAADFKWTKIVTTSDNATEFYIEKKSIKKVGKLHFYWLMANYLKHEENDDPNVNSVITSNILNCKTSEVKTVTYTSFNSNRARGIINTEMIESSILYEPITELGEYLFSWGSEFSKEVPRDLI